MNIGLVAQPIDGVLPPRQNSIGLVMYNTALQLARNENVTLYFKRRRDVSSDGWPFGIEMIDSLLDDALDWTAGRYPRWADRLGLRSCADKSIGYGRAVSRAMERRSCDVVHLMNYWPLCRALRAPGRALVLEMHSEWLSQMDAGQVQRQLESVDAIVGVSGHIANLVRRSFPDYQGLIETVYNGVDIDFFCPPETASSAQRGGDGKRRVLFVGRLSPEKGAHVLIEAFAEVARRFPEVVLDLVGPRTVSPYRYLVGLSTDPLVRQLAGFYDGSVTHDYQDYLNRMVARFGLENRVQFLGNVSHRDLLCRYQSADVVVNASLSESFGLSMIEAMATAVPVVATRVGGMLETVLDGETGLLVDAADPAALADATIKVLEDPKLACRLGRLGRSRAVETFSWRTRGDRLLAIYRQVAKRPVD